MGPNCHFLVFGFQISVVFNVTCPDLPPTTTRLPGAIPWLLDEKALGSRKGGNSSQAFLSMLRLSYRPSARHLHRGWCSLTRRAHQLSRRPLEREMGADWRNKTLGAIGEKRRGAQKKMRNHLQVQGRKHDKIVRQGEGSRKQGEWETLCVHWLSRTIQCNR